MFVCCSTAAVLFVFLSLLEPYIEMIPKASLSVTIIIALIPVIDYKIILPLWRNCSKLIGKFSFIYC